MSTQSDNTDGMAPVGMRCGARSRRAALTAAVAAASLAVSLTAGCTRHGRDDDRSPQHTPAPARPAPAAPSSAPAVTAAGSPLAVKIDNAPAARPQTGLEAADVVYAEQVEGGLSRLMAVYATRLPAAVGPVRSARESDLELLRQFGRPALAFSGAQHKLLPLIGRAPLRVQSPDRAPRAYYRATGRPAPHNLYLRPARLLSAAPGGAALTTGFGYGPAPSSGGIPTLSRTVRYPAARFTFTWSAARGGWLVAMDGTPAVSAGGTPLVPATVVVQYVRIRASRFHDRLGNRTPYTETVGSGEAEVLRDGRSFAASWSRPAATGGTTFKAADGSRMNFAAGPVWVVFTPAP
ncbi:DUF3048 domain-containing protein [Streptomyces sp. FXJ1.172]|uniref:DUF3048 domain-containing protein n=1 Tax=Streptomyces sp. FXJ1.172 TaxID=710705 RepID=UPI001F3F5318|nr:DUF3048 domain-containing protein [Streptomyces sp. FXJ1.172]WEO94141.1 DUF3048 domain-containing protein [Streptomyces sp. FXJ1.172]